MNIRDAYFTVWNYFADNQVWVMRRKDWPVGHHVRLEDGGEGDLMFMFYSAGDPLCYDFAPGVDDALAVDWTVIKLGPRRIK